MRRLLVVAAGAFLAVWVAVPASASTGWTVQPTPNPSGSTGASLQGVTCNTANECTAVGSYIDSSGGAHTLAEYFNGSTWAIQPTPNPGDGGILQDVACISATSCTAVGGYTDSSGFGVALAEHWNGSTWVTQALPVPSGAVYTSLNVIKCFGTTSCFAVGSFSQGGDDQALIEHWNGTKWSVQAAPASSPGDLYGISCTSSTSCYAVGENGLTSGPVQPKMLLRKHQVEDVSSAGAGALILHWNGKTWAAQSSPAVPKEDGQAPDYVVLASVGCWKSDCTAAGYANYPGSGTPESSPTFTLIERWNGKTWTIQKSQNPAGDSPGNDFLYAVRCVSATSCTAVGVYGDDADGSPGLPLVEHWNGSTWTVVAAPDPSGGKGFGSGFFGLTCPSATTCTAVGIYYNSSFEALTLAERN